MPQLMIKKTASSISANIPATTHPAAVHAKHSLGSLWQSVVRQINFQQLLHDNRLANWLTLLLAILGGVVVGRLAAAGCRGLALRLERRNWHFQAVMVDSLASPLSLAILAAGLLVGLGQLHLSTVLETFSGKILLLLLAISIFWYGFNIVATVELALKRFIARHDTPLTEQIVPIVRKTLRIFVTIIGALFILQNVFDRDIGSWLAGLGIAGLAVSLAAQDSLKNLFGSVTIFMDRPFLVGHSVSYQGITGKVEEIGFRSTRVRQTDGSLVTIPNSDIVSNSVTNISMRPFIRRAINVTVACDTPVTKMNQAVKMIRDLLASPEFGPSVTNPTDPTDNPPRVYFTDFNADSLNIAVYYCFRPSTDYWRYMEFSERFNLALLRELERLGVEIAFPTRTLYLAGDPKRKLSINISTPTNEQSADPVQQP